LRARSKGKRASHQVRKHFRMNKHHQEILALIRQHSGKPTEHTFSDSYLGTSHPRYPINIPTLRTIASAWMKEHATITQKELLEVLTSLVEGKSSTEKVMAGLMLGYTSAELRAFNPSVLSGWLDHLEGWAEVDSICSSNFSWKDMQRAWPVWQRTIERLSRNKNIHHRRASLVLLCTPLRSPGSNSACALALQMVEKLQHEREILITKAISWVLRTMIKHHREAVEEFLEENKTTLPAIAVREVKTKLKTGKK
jgi:3-methyladenine DNA glycosylase AlkD